MVQTKDLKKKYQEDVVPVLMEEFSYRNVYQVPKLEKIVINMGVGECSHNTKLVETFVSQLSKIAGQKPVVTKAKKSIASYKLREGMPVGFKVTLRGQRMYDFLQKLNCVVFPRIRDFRGVSSKSFDGRGNYTFGLKEQALFPEIGYEEIDMIAGMDISVVTTAQNDQEARALLTKLGVPFKK